LTLRTPASAACAAFAPNGRARAELWSQISVGKVAEPGSPKVEAVSESAEALSAIGLLPRIGGGRVPGYGGVAGGEPVFRVRVAERLCVGLELNFQVAEPLTFIQPNLKLAISRRLVLQLDA